VVVVVVETEEEERVKETCKKREGSGYRQWGFAS
jgi:hypothetical protein